MKSLRIRTERLQMIAASLHHVLAEATGPRELAEALGIDVPESWPPGEYDRDALEYFREKLEEGGGECRGWYNWYVMSLSDEGEPQELIAAAGFLGPPSAEGEVEIGYSVVPEARGRGYAAEIVEALVQYASSAGGVGRVIAHTSSANDASASVLSRTGFHAVESDADVIRHERLIPRDE